MNTQVFFEIISSAPILFFILGVFARFIRSDLDIPQPLPKFFSLYILTAIGLKGGVELARANLHHSYGPILLFAVVGSFFITTVGYYIFKRVTTHANAVALSASYGSISAITFITGSSLLDKIGIAYGPYMIAAMALMEAPAILMAMVFYQRGGKASSSFLSVFHHAITNHSIVLLLGGFVVGLILSESAWAKVSPFYDQVFYGLLTLFLLDLGLVAAEKFEGIRKAPVRLFFTVICFQVIAAFFAFFIARLLQFSIGDTFLFMLLFGSASYIAAPAAMRTAVPEANPSLYLSLAMGITFPLNILIGIPFYLWVISLYK